MTHVTVGGTVWLVRQRRWREREQRRIDQQMSLKVSVSLEEKIYALPNSFQPPVFHDGEHHPLAIPIQPPPKQHQVDRKAHHTKFGI